MCGTMGIYVCVFICAVHGVGIHMGELSGYGYDCI